MTTYYVRADGDDTRSGVTNSDAWQTLSRVRTALANSSVKRGDSVLFRRGDTFFGSIGTIPAQGLTGPSQSKLRFGFYGNGSKLPRFDGRKICNNPSGWVEHSPGIWKIDLTSVGSAAGHYTGNTINSTKPMANANAGFINVNGTIYSRKRWSLETLANDWEFYSDETFTYVKLPVNPTSRASDIRIAVDIDLVGLSHSVVLAGIEFVGTGGNAINGGAAGKDVKVIGCDIHEVGGSWLYGTTRYGNAIQFWIGAEDVDIAYNRISDVYDTATTLQGPAGTTLKAWRNIHFRHNLIWNSNQIFELWSEGNGYEANPEYGFFNCSFKNNTCINAGYSFAAETRPDRNGSGTHILNYNLQLSMDVEVSGNTFFGAKDNYFFRNTGDFKPPAGYQFFNNDIFLRPGQKISYQLPQTVEQSAEWSTSTGADKDSRFYTIPEGINTVDDVLAYLAGHEGLSSARAKNNALGIQDLAATFGSIPDSSTTPRVQTITPSVGFWETAPGHGPLSATLVGNIVHLSGVIARTSTATTLNMADGTGYGLAGPIPSDMLPRNRKFVPVMLFPNAGTAGAIRGFMDISNEWTEIRVAAVGAVAMTPGVSRIAFDGASYAI